MVRLVKILSYYPIVLISGILLLVTRVFGWGCLVAFLMFAGIKVAGEFDVSWMIVGSLLGVGVVALLLADAYIELLGRLDIADGRRNARR